MFNVVRFLEAKDRTVNTDVLLPLTTFHVSGLSQGDRKSGEVVLNPVQRDLCFCSCQSSIFFYLPFAPSHGFLWPSLDKHLLLPDLSAHAAGMEVSSGIPWIISSAYSPSADMVGTTCASQRSPTGLVIAKLVPYLSLLVPAAFIELSLSSRVALLPESVFLFCSCFFCICFFSKFFPALFIGAFSVWRTWGHWHKRCARKRTALPLFVTMVQGSVKLVLLGMMLQEQFSLPSWVVPGIRWRTASIIPYWARRRLCCPIPCSPAQGHLFLCRGLAQPWVICVTLFPDKTGPAVYSPESKQVSCLVRGILLKFFTPFYVLLSLPLDFGSPCF